MPVSKTSTTAARVLIDEFVRFIRQEVCVECITDMNLPRRVLHSTGQLL